MSDTDLRDQAVAHLKRTTVGYVNRNWKTPPPQTEWAKGLALLDQIGAAPPAPSLTLDAFEVVLQPNNFDGGDSTDHKTAAWASFNSPVTPRKAPNGQAQARFLYKGDWVRYLKGYKWLTAESVGGADNHHDVAGDTRWGLVSGFRMDIHNQSGESGHRLEATCEYERIQDTDPKSPQSGGAHYGYPDYLLALNEWHWLLTEYKVGDNEDGIVKVTDWVTGKVLVDVEGINTIAPGASWSQGWEGGYVSEGVGSVARARQTPALYALASDPVAKVLEDKPVLVDRWGTQARANATASAITLSVEKVQVPASPLLT